jgi:hypothetical protein
MGFCYKEKYGGLKQFFLTYRNKNIDEGVVLISLLQVQPPEI